MSSLQTDRRFEVIVLDNASRVDEQPNAAMLPPGARLIQSEANLGFAEGNNCAAAEAQGGFWSF